MGYIPVASHCNRYGAALAAQRRFRNRPRAPGSLGGDSGHPHRLLLRSAACVAGSHRALPQPLGPPSHVPDLAVMGGVFEILKSVLPVKESAELAAAAMEARSRGRRQVRPWILASRGGRQIQPWILPPWPPDPAL